jgi:threonine/homoserine/homoserine lactone efflux protein
MTSPYLLEFFAFGAISGFFSSTPLGPINLWVADHKLSRLPTRDLMGFLLAVILVDIIYAGAGLSLQFNVLEDAKEIKYLGIVSGLFTVILGCLLFYRAKNPKTQSVPHQAGWAKSFFQGAFLTAFNPAFLMFWLFVANQLITRVDRELSAPEVMVFLLGVIVGDGFWFSLYIWILTHLSFRAQESTLTRLRLLVSSAFVIIGLFAVGTYVFR